MWRNQSHRFVSRGIYGRWKDFDRCIDSCFEACLLQWPCSSESEDKSDCSTLQGFVASCKEFKRIESRTELFISALKETPKIDFYSFQKEPSAHSSCGFSSCVSTLLISKGCCCCCCCPIGWDCVFSAFSFLKKGSRWSDEIRVTFGWPLLDKDSVHQLSSVIICCFYAKGLFVAFVAFAVEHRAFKTNH